jgi:hypothetical protein
MLVFQTDFSTKKIANNSQDPSKYTGVSLGRDTKFFSGDNDWISLPKRGKLSETSIDLLNNGPDLDKIKQLQGIMGKNTTAFLKIEENGQSYYVKVNIKGGESWLEVEDGRYVRTNKTATGKKKEDIAISGTLVYPNGKEISQLVNIVLDYEQGYKVSDNSATAAAKGFLKIAQALLIFPLIFKSGPSYEKTQYLSKIITNIPEAREIDEYEMKGTKLTLLGLQFGNSSEVPTKENSVFFNKGDFENYLQKIEIEKKLFNGIARDSKWNINYKNGNFEETLPGATYEGINQNGKLVFSFSKSPGPRGFFVNTGEGSFTMEIDPNSIISAKR